MEILSLRQENSKTFRVQGGRQSVFSMGAVHYKDNYASDEPWKDIDLTWEKGRITKAPFELTLDGNKVTIRDKKSGEVSTIEPLDVGGVPVVAQVWNLSNGLAKGQGVEIKVDSGHVRVVRTINSDSDPKESQFRVTGSFHSRARDDDGEEHPVQSAVKDGILTETLVPDRAVKYPVQIDPTWQVGASTDDVLRVLSSDLWSRVTANQAGGGTVVNQQYGCGLRFTGVTIPNGATIDSAKLTFRCKSSRALNTVNTRISAEDADDPATFADDADAFDTRFANHTTARVDWDAIAAWTADSDYDSPEIKTVVQEIVDRPGWDEKDMVFFWEDFDGRSTPDVNNTLRQAYSWDGDSDHCPILTCTYLVAYDEDASVVVGIAVSVSKSWGRAIASSVVVGIAVSVSKSWGAIISSSVVVGMVVSCSKVFACIRKPSVVVGIAVSVSKSWPRAIASSVVVGIVASATESWGRAIASSVVVGIVASATKAYDTKRAAAIIVGVKSSASRAVTILRTTSVIIGIVTSALKGWGRALTSAVRIGVVTSASRAITLARTSAVVVGIVATASKSWARSIASSVIVGTLVSASRVRGITRSATVIVGMGVSATRVAAFVRKAEVLIGVTASVIKSWIGHRLSRVRALLISKRSRVTLLISKRSRTTLILRGGNKDE